MLDGRIIRSSQRNLLSRLRLYGSMAVQPVRPALANDQDQNQVKSLPWSELQDVRRDKAFRCQTAKISLKSHRRIIHRLSQFGAYFFHPSKGINAVHNPAKETQPLGNIVAVETNVFFARPDIE